MSPDDRLALTYIVIAEYQTVIDHVNALIRLGQPDAGVRVRLEREQREQVDRLGFITGRTRCMKIATVSEAVTEARAWLAEHPETIDRFDQQEVTA